MSDNEEMEKKLIKILGDPKVTKRDFMDALTRLKKMRKLQK